MMPCLIVIPARLKATRLPNKPMADIGGEPMIVHVWRRAVEADCGPVVVATDAEAVRDAILQAGGEALMTLPGHPSGSDRVFEAVLARDPHRKLGAVVNLQGDLPTLDPALVRACLRALDEGDADIGTIGYEIAVFAERAGDVLTPEVRDELKSMMLSRR